MAEIFAVISSLYTLLSAYPIPPLLYVGHVVFGGYDRRPLVRLREARTFVAVDPLFERFDTPRFGVVEDVV